MKSYKSLWLKWRQQPIYLKSHNDLLPSICPGGHLPGHWSIHLLFILLTTLFFLMSSVQGAIATEQNPLGLQEKLRADIESAITGHQTELAELNERMKHLEIFAQSVAEALDRYESESMALRQLLLTSQLEIDELERGIRNNQAYRRKMIDFLNSLQSSYNATVILFQQADEHATLAENQLSEIRESSMSEESKQMLEKMADNLVRLLNNKKQIGEKYQKMHAELADQINKAIQENEAFAKTLSTTMERRLKRMLFTPNSPYRHIFSEAFAQSLTTIRTRLGRAFNRSAWQSQWAQVRKGGLHRWAIFAFWLALTIVAQARLKRHLKRIESNRDGPEWHNCRMVLFLLRQSLPYLGLTLLFGIYSSADVQLLDDGQSYELYLIFLVLLLTCWGKEYLNYTSIGTPSQLRLFVSRHLLGLFRLMRYIVVGTLLVSWIIGRDNLLSLIARDLAALVLLGWTALFWHRLKPFLAEQVRKGIAMPDQRKLTLIQWWSYAVTAVGFLVSLSGYSTLGGHWSTAWIKTVTIVFWGQISLKAIGEWQRANAARQATDDDHSSASRKRLGWALIQLLRALWLVAMVRGIIWAWDRAGILMLKVKALFEWAFTIGKLQLSIKGIVLAAVVIFFTHVSVNIARTLLNEKLLDRKSLEPGLRDSIRTITTYVAWGVGLIVALASIGVDATSLAVVFGALSVGIGFGLQNIVNNFISGLILLFERPIQVGDYIEVNGIWAEVKEINVRATVVQTFDNASVIIPNAEIISQQVTNWSFRDKRMRRNLEIGVAYGSDIDLVERTLLDISKEFKAVLKFPKPEVLFIDHADSALIFRLRFWVHVSDYWIVPSKIRFEIDRRFRELNIEIAFPQRDIHIRSIHSGPAITTPNH